MPNPYYRSVIYLLTITIVILIIFFMRSTTRASSVFHIVMRTIQQTQKLARKKYNTWQALISYIVLSWSNLDKKIYKLLINKPSHSLTSLLTQLFYLPLDRSVEKMRNNNKRLMKTVNLSSQLQSACYASIMVTNMKNANSSILIIVLSSKQPTGCTTEMSHVKTTML